MRKKFIVNYKIIVNGKTKYKKHKFYANFGEKIPFQYFFTILKKINKNQEFTIYKFVEKVVI